MEKKDFGPTISRVERNGRAVAILRKVTELAKKGAPGFYLPQTPLKENPPDGVEEKLEDE